MVFCTLAVFLGFLLAHSLDTDPRRKIAGSFFRHDGREFVVVEEFGGSAARVVAGYPVSLLCGWFL